MPRVSLPCRSLQRSVPPFCKSLLLGPSTVLKIVTPFPEIPTLNSVGSPPAASEILEHTKDQPDD